MKPILPSGAKFIINRLESEGRSAHIVGGCVRDFLLSKRPYDYDITTSALPEEMKRIFSDVKTVETGIKHGTLTVVYDREPYEVTTYRIDGEYEDHRHPKSVSFTDSLRGDLSRRDFTMNAIAYNERDGFVDLFGGIEDIKGGIIRAVGDPSRRFDEDALRILRAVRFSATLGFSVEDSTAKSAAEKAHLLSSVSGERIYTEWKKLIAGDFAYDVIVSHSSVMRQFLLDGSLRLPDKLRFAKADPMARMLSIFALSAADAPSAFLSFTERMKSDSKTKRDGIAALSELSADMSEPKAVRRLLIKHGKEKVRLIYGLKRLLGMDGIISEAELCEAESGKYPLSLSELCVGGDDMKAIGYRGRDIGDILLMLLNMAADGEVKNEREELLEAARKRLV